MQLPVTRRLEELLAVARDRLSRAPFKPPRREAMLLLAKTLETTEAEVLAHPERVLTDDEQRRIEDVLDRRLTGEPVAYLFGEREFWGRLFAVDPRVLIPRPETEHLVETALRIAGFERTRVVDVGTGSACIAITLSLERPELVVIATDLSPAALAVATSNRTRHRAPIALVAGDLLGAIRRDRIGMVVANLPYIADDELAQLSPEIRDHEPATALVAADDGLALVRRLLGQCRALARGTPVLLEIGAAQADRIVAIGAEYDLRLSERLSDYAGHDRVLVFER